MVGKAGFDYVKIDGELFPCQIVHFDSAVAAENRGEAGAGGGISVLGIDVVKADARTHRGETRTSRISFSVPVIYPVKNFKDAVNARRPLRYGPIDDGGSLGRLVAFRRAMFQGTPLGEFQMDDNFR